MKGRFQRFLHDQRGSAPLWAMFFIITFFMVAAVVYNAHAMYSNYYAVKDELTRCCAISLARASARVSKVSPFSLRRLW